ncbi:hypothetical protein ACWEIK_31275 [Streptomyces sp. NPDC004673]
MRLFLKSLLRFFADALVAFGRSQLFIPDADFEEPAPDSSERISRKPLTEAEEALDRQLAGVAERVDRRLDPF